MVAPEVPFPIYCDGPRGVSGEQVSYKVIQGVEKI